MSGTKTISGTSASAEPETLVSPDSVKSTEASTSPEAPEVSPEAPEISPEAPEISPEAPEISPEAPDASLGIASVMRGSSSSC